MFVRAPGEGAHKIRYDVLFFMGLAGVLRKGFEKRFKNLARRFAHQGQNIGADMFRRDFQLTAGKFGRIRLQGVLVV